jgi:hypothetical protein
MFRMWVRSTEESAARAARRAAFGAMLVLLHVAVPAADRARAEEQERPGWTVGLSAGLEILELETRSSVESAIAPGQSGSQTHDVSNSNFKVGLEGMTPALESWPGRPRLFAGAGAQLPITSDFNLFEIGEFSEGQPEEGIEGFEQDCLVNPNPNPMVCDAVGVESFSGQGSAIDAEFDPSWYVSLGAVLNFDLPSDLLFRFYSSVEYMGTPIHMRGMLVNVSESSPDTFTVARSSADSTLIDHRLGPGLEIELVVSRSARPIAASVYIDSRFLWPVGESSTSFADPAGIARYTVEVDKALTVGAGIRLTWMTLGR